MSDLEPLEPTSVRHVLDQGRRTRGGEQVAFNHVDYRFGVQPNALWARAQIESMDKVTLHNVEQHDLDSEHAARVLMYLYARFPRVDLFDPDSEEGYLPVPANIERRVHDLLVDFFSDRDLKVAGWDEPNRPFKA
ncbi:MAG: hypothetical protein WEB63_02570 [Cucumibacter sp.]